MGLRATIEEGLATTLEDPDGYGLPVVLISPTGVVYDAASGHSDLYGQIIYETTDSDEAGNTVIMHDPVVTLRRSSLTRVPLDTDRPRWACRIPVSPVDGAIVETFIVEQVAADGGSIGYVSLRLTKAEQSS